MDINQIVGQAIDAGVSSEQKPGYKTTEFGMVSTVVSYLVLQDTLTHNWLYACLAAGLALGYSIVRAYVKSA